MERTELIMHSSNRNNNKLVVPASTQANEIGRAGITRADENDWNVWEANVGSFLDPGPIGQSILGEQEDKGRPPKTFKATRKPLVNVKQAERRKKTGGKFEYGLPRNYDELYPTLASELDDFYQFMTEPSTSSQGEDPIRPATAKIYLRHAKLFLGWYLAATKHHHDALNEGVIYHPFTLSINNVIPTKQKESAQTVIDFVMWLRRERQVSAGYEANLLRGIIKLLKFRFRIESEESSAALTFVDIPIIQELRKLHRTAEQKNRNGPRSSDEQKKWLSWPEYLKVIEKTKQEVEQMRLAFEVLDRSLYRYRGQDEKTTARDDNDHHLYCQQQQEIAQAFQRYLILAIFACIPDRQRTIRELELGRTLIREAGNDCWVIKHGPDDYKTGDAYGERPPMQLAPELTTALDEFVEKWRPALCPDTNFLFVQAMTGQPLTADSVYQRVSQSCYKYTGQRTNPHLLRSMIITHVREVSNASEKDLEALALFMGHSIQMQRSSYDKRTLEKKIAPAVQLLQTVNRKEKKSLN
jgi:integrase